MGEGVSLIRGKHHFGTKFVKVNRTEEDRATTGTRTGDSSKNSRQRTNGNEEEAEEDDKFEFLLLLLLQQEFLSAMRDICDAAGSWFVVANVRT